VQSYLREVSHFLNRDKVNNDYAGNRALAQAQYGKDFGKHYMFDSPYVQERENFAYKHGELWG